MQSYSYNGEVERYFKNDDGDSDRDETKRLCLIQSTDSWTTAKIRMDTFYHRVLKTHLQPNGYRLPISDNGDVAYKPQVTLYFRQDLRAVPTGGSILDAEISFRWMDETSTSLTEAKLLSLANRINSEIGGNTPFKFTKGKTACYYKDLTKGYDFRLLCSNETEGESVIKKVMAIQNHAFDQNLYRHCMTPRSNTAPPATETILTKRRRKNRWRPNGIVEFQWAEMFVHGLKPTEQPVLLDLSGVKKNPIKTA
jgi:hypothetical protein